MREDISTEFRFTSTDGLRVACARWDSRGPVRGVVQIAHGMGEHIGRYAGTIEVLVAAGFEVYGNDHRGHGRTAPSTPISETSDRAALTCLWRTCIG
jgi:alpha-beta hydrolase superfamily lysophospholipase